MNGAARYAASWDWTGTPDLSAYSRADRWDSEYLANLDGPLMLVVNSSTTGCLGHDPLYSPVALVDSSGLAIERVEYDAYGRMAYRFTPDVNGDGYVTASDLGVLWDNWGGRDFNCDLNRDGSVDYGDQQILMQYWGTAISSSSGNFSGNPVGFTGRTLDLLDGGDLASMYYRYRSYSPGLGRFGQRDPLGVNILFHPQYQYINGLSTAIYVLNNPISYMDPTGLARAQNGYLEMHALGEAGQPCCNKYSYLKDKYPDVWSCIASETVIDPASSILVGVTGLGVSALFPPYGSGFSGGILIGMGVDYVIAVHRCNERDKCIDPGTFDCNGVCISSGSTTGGLDANEYASLLRRLENGSFTPRRR